jgi:pilus assembly protein CpaE
MVSDRNRALALIPRFAETAPGTNVIVLLAANEPDLILKSLRLGASEFMLRPFSAEQLEAALSKLVLPPPGCGDAAGRVFCVMPAKGACGASTIAMNLALIWKRTAGNRVLLADMDPLTGILSFLLKVKPQYTFMDVMNRAHSLDDDLWKAMITTTKNLDVLLAPDELIEGVSELKDASPIVTYARGRYDMAVLDAGRPYGEWNLSLARAADEVLLVTTNELPALQGAQRVLAYFDANEISRTKVRVVLNRYNEEIGLGRDVVSSALHAEVVEVIGAEYEAVQDALIDGRAIAPASKMGKGLAALAATLAGPAAAAEKKPATNSLLSLFSRTS